MFKTMYERSLYCIRATTEAFCCQCGGCGREFLTIMVKDVEPKINQKQTNRDDFCSRGELK